MRICFVCGTRSYHFNTLFVQTFFFSHPAFDLNLFVRKPVFLDILLPFHHTETFNCYPLVYFSLELSRLMMLLKILCIPLRVSVLILSIVSAFNTIHIFLLYVRRIQVSVALQFGCCFGLLPFL